VSVSMVVAAPAGSLLEVVIGWRGVFGVAAMLGIVCVVWQLLSFPPMPAPDRPGNVVQVFALLRRPGVAVAMMTMATVFAGQFSFFTFIRPFFEIRGGFHAADISLVLMILGIANFAGTSLSSLFLRVSLKMTLAIAPFVMASASACLLMLATDHIVALVITAIWGAAMGCVPVAWSTWVTRNLGDDAENAGGLQVALIQLANMVGAAVGGMIYDATGIAGPVIFGVVLLAGAALLMLLAVKVRDQIGSSRATA
jgi:MFS transporter, DHA1 family, purine ribonucleoside efflux pump